MERISNHLKEKRLEAGLTIEEVSEKTMLTVKHIKALEEGDMEFFKDDLSYLRFFLHSYCDAVGLDFEEIKPMLRESIDDYTIAFSKKMVEEHEIMEKSIETKSKKIHQPNQITSKKNKKLSKQSLGESKRLDFSLISLVIVVIVIVCGLGYALFGFILPGFNAESQSKNPPKELEIKTPVNEKKPNKDTQKKEEQEKQEKQISITKTDPYNYEISKVKDQQKLEVIVKFQSEAWFQLSKNAIALTNPVSKVYTIGETATIEMNASTNDAYTLRFGNWAGAHEITVNGIKVELDEAVIASKQPQNITLTIKGE